MKKLSCVLTILIIFSSAAAFAQNTYQGFSLGYTISEDADSFGIGLEAKSPLFLDVFIGKLGLSTVVSNHWYEGLAEGETEETWSPYQSVKLGLFLAQKTDYGFRPYSKLGALILFTNPDVDSESNCYGMYGDFGFEFFPGINDDSPASLFIELGSNSLFPAATADKTSETKPMYHHGFRTAAGFRYYF